MPAAPTEISGRESGGPGGGEDGTGPVEANRWAASAMLSSGVEKSGKRIIARISAATQKRLVWVKSANSASIATISNWALLLD